ncbi:hypothetical protein KFK09_022280 [Dendrobium nobile]|uniref:Growth-regulating factor n=1 Tax=Dendrobium nobile TaxID=94219 RepID=A0A8T3AIG4_DENNO|nr:hypothetical protein KFK09_022280 [Dendrobium nobile]
MMSGSGGSRYPFTASQWQELEHQALIYKYIASGIPIPSDLILPIRRSFLLDSTATSPSLAFPTQAQLGWSCFQMGFGKKAEDPEPGRCRRTDGKKWRCSKEAYLDSKYCERHMHRGKNRSRKPVEISLSAKTNQSSSSSPSSAHSSQFKAMGMSSIGQAKQNCYSLSKEEEEERQRNLRHFFDEWPQRNKDPWMDIEDENSSYTKTQLSISFPKWSFYSPLLQNDCDWKQERKRSHGCFFVDFQSPLTILHSVFFLFYSVPAVIA